jgi:lipoate-protein ligase A
MPTPNDASILAYPHDLTIINSVSDHNAPDCRVWIPERAEIVLGRASRMDVELNVEAVQADGVPVLRRRGGGCAVLLDPGNLIVQAAMPVSAPGDLKKRFDAFTDWLIAGLAACGHDGISRQGISDLARGDRKLAGSALYVSRRVLYYACSLLVAPRLDLMTRYLAHPPREPDYRRSRVHADFVEGLQPEASRADIDRLSKDLFESLKTRMPVFDRE